MIDIDIQGGWIILLYSAAWFAAGGIIQHQIDKHLQKTRIEKEASRIKKGFDKLMQPMGHPLQPDDVVEYYCDNCHIKIWSTQPTCWSCGRDLKDAKK